MLDSKISPSSAIFVSVCKNGDANEDANFAHIYYANLVIKIDKLLK